MEIVPVIKRVVAIGPESTGKSTLCEQLAQHYQSAWCPEYAREFLLSHNKQYNYEDLLTIAEGQVALEEKTTASYLSQTTKHLSPFFIDTDMYVMKVWCEFVFEKCHRFILNQIVERKYDLYLLCNADLEWTRDELREYPDLLTRKKLFSIYKDCMVNQDVPWIEVSGDYEQRFGIAVNTVDQLLKA